MLFVASLLSTEHRGERAKTGWLRIRIMSPSWAIYLSADCCFSELTLYKLNLACWSSTKWISSSTCSLHDIAQLALNTNHSQERSSLYEMALNNNHSQERSSLYEMALNNNHSQGRSSLCEMALNNNHSQERSSLYEMALNNNHPQGRSSLYEMALNDNHSQGRSSL